MQDSSNGVLGLLEVILADFARLAVETGDAEDLAAAAYKKYMEESVVELAAKETEVKHLGERKVRTEENLMSTKKELKLTQEELDTAMEYYSKLKVDCVDTGLNYQERVQNREQEIASLKEALHILEQSDFSLL